jgi:hypothetical protein
MHKRMSLAAAVLMFFSCSALAQEPQPRVPVVPEKKSEQTAAQTLSSNPEVAHPLDAADLSAFFDGIIPL